MRNRIVFMFLGTLAVIAILAFVIMRLVTPRGRESNAAQVTEQPDETYMGLRKLALGIIPEDIGITVEPNSKEPYGILMEMSFPEVVATLTSYKSGDASIYFSTGGGILGGIGHESVRNAAKRFVSAAQNYVDKMESVTSYPLPEAGKAKFYVLTPQGILTVEANMEDLEKGGSELSLLFYAGQDVITELRLLEEETSK
jgi:hypothetical protein